MRENIDSRSFITECLVHALVAALRVTARSSPGLQHPLCGFLESCKQPASAFPATVVSSQGHMSNRDRKSVV